MRHDYDSNPVAIMERDQCTSCLRDIKITSQIVTFLTEKLSKEFSFFSGVAPCLSLSLTFITGNGLIAWILNSWEIRYLWGGLETPFSGLRNKLFTAALSWLVIWLLSDDGKSISSVVKCCGSEWVSQKRPYFTFLGWLWKWGRGTQAPIAKSAPEYNHRLYYTV